MKNTAARGPAEVCEHKKWSLDSDNIGTCENPECGERRQFPWEKGGKVTVLRESKLKSEKGSPSREKIKYNVHERHRFYQDNMQAIIDDLLSIGRIATRKKWDMRHNSTLFNLEMRWLTPQQRARIIQVSLAIQAGMPIPTPSNNGLPDFPAFSMAWPPEIQLKWLEIYERMMDHAH